MEKSQELNLVKIFRETLKSRNDDLSSLYHHIFSIPSDQGLEDSLKFMMEVKDGKCDFINPDDWFYQFHKSIRQTDFFDRCQIIVEDPQISEGESIELNNLKNELDRFLKDFSIDEKRIIRGNYRILEKHSPDDFKRLKTLNSKKLNTRTDSISGHLDMILWNTIHIDNDGILMEVLKRTFNEYQFLMDESK